MAAPSSASGYRQTLLNTLNTRTNCPGDFSCAGVLGQGVLPRLEVPGMGALHLPLSQHQALALKQLCQQAPFGRGSATVVDTAVRNTLQLSSEQFSIGNAKAWFKAIDKVLKEVQAGLGVQAGAEVEAQLYKLLLYEPGSFFLPHKDSEKAPGMFGTLSIMLPSTYTGGELLLHHGGRTHTYGSAQLQGSAGASAVYAAWYADVEHEVKPLVYGYRLALTYNLVRRGCAQPLPSTVNNQAQIDSLCAAVAAWEADAAGPCKLLYMLDHKYTQWSLQGLESLKHGDCARGLLLRAVAQQTGLNVAVAQLTYHQLGEADEDKMFDKDLYYDYEDEDEDGDKDTEDSDLMIDLYEEELTVRRWVPIAGAEDMAAAKDTELGIEDVLQGRHFFDNHQPDREEVTGPTGNEGCPMDRWYESAALVIWPKKYHLAVLASSLGVAWLVEQLQAKLNDLQSLQQQQQQEQRQQPVKMEGQQRQHEQQGLQRQQGSMQQGQQDQLQCADPVKQEEQSWVPVKQDGFTQQQCQERMKQEAEVKEETELKQEQEQDDWGPTTAVAGNAVEVLQAQVLDMAQVAIRMGAQPNKTWGSVMTEADKPPRDTAMTATAAKDLLQVLTQLGDAQLLTSFITTGPLTRTDIDLSTMAGALVAACTQLGWGPMGPQLVQMAKQRLTKGAWSSNNKSVQQQVVTLLCHLAGVPEHLPPGTAQAQQQAYAALPGEQQAACLAVAGALISTGSSSGGSTSSGGSSFGLPFGRRHSGDVHSMFAERGAQLLACQIVILGLEQQLQQYLTSLLRTPPGNTHEADMLLQPTLQLGRWLGPQAASTCPTFTRLFNACAAWLLPRTRAPPDPGTWMAMHGKLDCSCRDCSSFQSFLRSSTRTTWRMQGLKRECEHVRQVACRLSSYYIVVVELDSSKHPFVLTATKTNAGFKARVAQFHQDLQNAAQLDALLPAPPASSSAPASSTACLTTGAAGGSGAALCPGTAAAGMPTSGTALAGSTQFEGVTTRARKAGTGADMQHVLSRWSVPAAAGGQPLDVAEMGTWNNGDAGTMLPAGNKHSRAASAASATPAKGQRQQKRGRHG